MTRRATLFFEPLDVLQFRDHRPFDAGYNVTAESIFPMPSVFLGCVRTALLRMQGVRFGGGEFGLTEPWARELLGTPAKAGTLTLRGPLFARLVEKHVEPLFPAPFDTVLERDRNDKHRWHGHVLGPFKPQARRFHGPAGTLATHDVPWTEAGPTKDNPPLFTVDGAKHYFMTGPGDIQLEAAHTGGTNNIYKHEDRVGIARDDTTLTAEDRMFYVTRPFRLACGAGFAVDVELPGGEADKAIAALDGLAVPLGGKAHRARIRRFDNALIPPEIAADGAGAVARKLWLVTPLPLASDLAGWPKGISCAASDRTVPIGGFDMAARAPKPLRRALPTGTVLWLDGIAPSEALAALGGKGWQDDRRAGYGVALIAKGTEDR